MIHGTDKLLINPDSLKLHCGAFEIEGGDMGVGYTVKRNGVLLDMPIRDITVTIRLNEAVRIELDVLATGVKHDH